MIRTPNLFFKKANNIKKAPVTELVPPGQFVTERFPVLTYGAPPNIDLEKWTLRVFGAIHIEMELNWNQFAEIPWSVVEAPFHCVTQWSKLQNTWEGLLFTHLANLVQPKSEAKFVIIHCYGGYTTNLSLGTLLDNQSLLAHKHDGHPLDRDHGGPLRLVAPAKYGWKSAKWISGVEFSAEDRPGFWEVRGYHNEGDPWKEQRFWPELT